MRVLILRPAPGGAATARAVAAMGLHPVEVPLFEVRPVSWAPPDPARFTLIVMTSANAARHGGAQLARYTHLPVLAVGHATADAARAAGFADVRIGPGTAAALAPLIASASALHITGADHHAIAGAEAVVIYASMAVPVDAVALVGDIALVHSVRAGERLAELKDERAETSVVAISPAAAAACGGGWRAVHVAAAPTEDALLATLAASV